MTCRRVARFLSLWLVPAVAAVGQPPAAQRPAARLQRTFERNAPAVGDPLPDVTLFDSKGRPVRLRSLKEHYTVLVFGCLT